MHVMCKSWKTPSRSSFPLNPDEKSQIYIVTPTYFRHTAKGKVKHFNQELTSGHPSNLEMAILSLVRTAIFSRPLTSSNFKTTLVSSWFSSLKPLVTKWGRCVVFGNVTMLDIDNSSTSMSAVTVWNDFKRCLELPHFFWKISKWLTFWINSTFRKFGCFLVGIQTSILFF